MKIAVGVAFLLAALVPAGDVKMGEAAPDVSLKSIDGKDIKLSELGKEKVVVVFSWAPGCPSNAIPRSTEIVTKYAGNTKVEFLGVDSYKDTAEKVKGFCKDNSISYTICIDEGSAFGKAYNTKQVNTTYILKEGKLFWRGGVMKNGKDSVIEAIDAALAGKAAPAEMTKFAG